MKHRLKGLLALVLSLVMVLSMVTVSTASQSSGNGSTPTTYPVSIGGVDFASNNLVIDRTDIAGVTGSATYVPADGANPATLTLNNFVLENYHYSAIYATENLTINLIGATNKVTSSSDGGYSGGMAIYVDGDLKITGDNNASLTAGGGGQSAGIVSTGNTDLAGGAVTVNGTTGSSCIRNMSGKITISGGTVTVNGNSDRNSGIHAGSDITISGGTVNAEGINSNGIYSANGTVSITGGEVEATGRDSGIYANSVTITGGIVNATGSGDYGYGIYALESNSNGGDITISNGTVTAEGGRGGIGADDAVTITGGTVIAKGTTPTDSVGIHASGRLGGELTISGANTTVEVGCATGLDADIVNIAGGSTVSIEAKNANNENAINTTTLNMTGDYQWSKDNTNFTDSNTSKLTKEIAIGTAKLYIKPLSGSAPGNPQPYPPYIYNPTPTPEPEKVDSAKTFDAGIGLYIGMTILSATGGAWLAKKKD